MDWIPAKLRTIRQEFKMTQLELAQASGLSQRDISQLENGRKEGLPKEYIQFLHTRGVDLNWLFADPAQPQENKSESLPGAVRKYAAAEDYPLAALVQEGRRVGYGLATPAAPRVAPGPDSAARISMADVQAQQQYPRRHLEPGFLQALPLFTLALPEVQQGMFRCFQLADAAMQPAYAPQDWVIARFEKKTAPVAQGAVYVVITKDAVRVRRVSTRPRNAKALLLKSDAAGFADVEQPLAGILELWSVQGHLSFQRPVAGPAAEQQVTTLEASLQDLLDRVQRLEQGR